MLVVRVTMGGKLVAVITVVVSRVGDRFVRVIVVLVLSAVAVVVVMIVVVRVWLLCAVRALAVLPAHGEPLCLIAQAALQPALAAPASCSAWRAARIPLYDGLSRMARATEGGSRAGLLAASPRAMNWPVARRACMAATERFTLTTRHGQRLVGLIDYPPGAAPVPRTLVLCHGYGGDKDGRYLRQIAATLNEAGDAAIRFDFTNGAGESEGTLRDALVAHYADDLDDVLDFVARQPRLAVSAVSIGGHSYAGMVVLAVAARRPGLAAVFFLSAVYNRTTDFDMPAIVARITAPIIIISAGADSRGRVRPGRRPRPRRRPEGRRPRRRGGG